MTEDARTTALRAATRKRWDRTHRFDRWFPKSRSLRCIVCNTKHRRSACPVHISECIFDGGRLERHECPSCGAIFGTQRMLRMGAKALAREYADLYSWYNEGDTTPTETTTFFAMNPRRDGVYLNYGSGRWSQAVPTLREQGWNVVGFEPYSQASDAPPHIVKNWSELEKMKFDGIMSHNVLEHMQDPVAELSRIAALLRGPESIMAHATPCYSYCYEFTRFHVLFLPGRSPEVLAERIGTTLEHFNADLPDRQTIKLYHPTAAMFAGKKSV